jgi:hypothetical protein
MASLDQVVASNVVHLRSWVAASLDQEEALLVVHLK